MTLEERALSFKSTGDRLVRFDITLPTVHDGNISKSEWDDTASKNVDNISAGIPGMYCLY